MPTGHTLTLQQERVVLHYGNNRVTFVWPFGTDVVTVSQSQRPVIHHFSVEEGHELFQSLLDAGAT